MDIEGAIPSRKTTGADRVKEDIGTGDNSATRFFFDNAYILASTYSLVYGATEATAVSALAEATHYTVDKDLGQINLTTAGVSAVTALSIFGTYSFCDIGLTDTQLQAALNQAQEHIDDKTNNHFATGTDATPDYNQVTNEEHDGKGRDNRDYYADNFPLPNVSTSLTSDVAIGATSLAVDSTAGFLSSGVIGIGSEKIVYASKDATNFTDVTAITAAHSDNDLINPYVVEISTTSAGTSPTFTVLTDKSDYDLDIETGRIHLYRSDLILDTLSKTYPPDIPDRFRVTYIYGSETIPEDIQLLCKMIAAKNLLHMAVRKAHASGQNEFNPDLINVDERWIEDTLKLFMNYQAINV